MRVRGAPPINDCGLNQDENNEWGAGDVSGDDSFLCLLNSDVIEWYDLIDDVFRM